jgi:hypothetical protein
MLDGDGPGLILFAVALAVMDRSNLTRLLRARSGVTPYLSPRGDFDFQFFILAGPDLERVGAPSPP